jgi:hypothetical protein
MPRGLGVEDEKPLWRDVDPNQVAQAWLARGCRPPGGPAAASVRSRLDQDVDGGAARFDRHDLRG